jgi:voltage-gated potassium channel
MKGTTEQIALRERLDTLLNTSNTTSARVLNIMLAASIIMSVAIGMSSSMNGLTSFQCDLFCNIEIGFASLFAIEYLLRLYAAPSRMKYLFSVYGLIDLIAILPVLFVGMQSSMAFRIARLLTMLRLLKFLRYWKDLVILTAAIKDSVRLLALVIMCVMVLAVIGGNLIYFVEPDNFTSPFEGIWWSLVTMSTVGYGDFVPHSLLGKVLAAFGMFIGISVFAVITAIIGSKIHVLTEQKHGYCDSCQNTIPIASRYCLHCGEPQQ